jgi:4-amino-4-deoxy-L-arabinose transferase-like glycosyltransferase
MLTNADTVVMASLKGPKGSLAGSSTKADDAAAKARNAAAVKQQAITAMVPAGTSAAFAEAVTQIMPTAEPSQHKPGAEPAPSAKARAKLDGPPAGSAVRYTPRRRTTMISRLLLLAILSLQAVLSLRLRNTAFEDESLYLYAGHMELQHLLHGAALYGGFSTYFSGAPVLYPVIAAALNQLGGLTAVRALSLVEMLATTALLYSLTRRLFNERIGLCAAALFSVSEAVIFLGNFATFDATCLFLLAFASWIVVRTAAFRWPVFLLAAPLAALAVAVKYAGLLFVPTIALWPALAGWPERGRRVLLYPLAFGVAVAGLLYAAVRLGGPAYLSAIKSTTTNRAQGTVPVGTILREAAEWGGVLFAAAVIGSVAYVWRVRTEPDEKIAPPGDRLRRIALGVVLTGTALLAPLYQAHLHTDISFLKHVGFGLFFAAPMAGFGLARVMGDYFRRPQFGIGIWSLALVLGMVQSNFLYHVWPSSGAFVNTFGKYLKPNALYLVEVPEVPIYYLEGRPNAQPKQFISTFPVPPLTTDKDFAAVVKTGEFQVIAYTGVVTPGPDMALGKALAASRSYYLAGKISTTDSSGPVTYYIWVKGQKSPTGSKAKKPGKAVKAGKAG